MSNSQNYYEILQVSQNATLSEIKSAFRRLARQYHPDLHPNQPTATEQFKKICQAYETLSDSQLRQQYDQTIHLQNNPIETNHFEEKPINQQEFYRNQDEDLTETIEYYNRILLNQPDSWQTYLKRAEVYHQLFKDSLVLEDCQSVLRINPHSDQAYYYLGLARQRLGYTQSAIEAYSKAIQFNTNRPEFFQHRGLAYEELDNYALAINDFRVAIRLFQKNREFHHVPSLQRKINSLLKQKGKTGQQWIRNIFESTFGSLLKLISASWLVIKHPQEGLLLAYMSLSKSQALIIGLIYGLITISIWHLISILPLFNQIVLGFGSFLFLSLSTYIARNLSKSYGYLAGDIFVGGFISLLVSLVFYLNLGWRNLPEAMLLTLTVILMFYLGYSLKNGYTQIANLPEKLAIFLTLTILSFITYSLIVWL